MKTILRRIAALYLSCASTSAFAGNLPGGTGVNFWVGYNQAWFADHYPNWLTANPVYNVFYGTNLFDSQFSATLNVISDPGNDVNNWLLGMGHGNAKIVRIWAFLSLQGIVPDQYNPPQQTAGVTPDFQDNLRTFFARVRACGCGLKVYVTALNGNDATYSPLQTYFRNLFRNSAARDAFKNKALGQLLDVLNENQEYTYALDVANEVEAVVNAGFTPNGWVGARDWIKNMAAFVKSRSPWLPVTSSAGWGWAVQEITFGLFSGLGLNFYDLHVYSDSGTYRGQTALCNKVSSDRVPIILGEYGQKSNIYSDPIQITATGNFLQGAKYGATRCFSAALAWQYEVGSQPGSEPWFTYLRPDLPRDPTSTCRPGTAFRPAYCTVKNFQ